MITGDDKIWVTASLTLSIGEFESVKVESGLSKTLVKGQDPLELISETQEELGDVLVGYALDLKKKLKRTKHGN